MSSFRLSRGMTNKIQTSRETHRQAPTMETIGQSALFSYLGSSPHAVSVRNTQVRKDRGHLVKS